MYTATNASSKEEALLNAQNFNCLLYTSWTNFGQQSQNLDENGEPMDAYFYYEGEPTIYANIEYREGIYVGYKYYETAYDDMNAAEEG